MGSRSTPGVDLDPFLGSTGTLSMGSRSSPGDDRDPFCDSGVDRDPSQKDPGRPHGVDRDTDLQLFLKILGFFTSWEAGDSTLDSTRDSRVFILDSRLSTLDSSPSPPDSPL